MHKKYQTSLTVLAIAWAVVGTPSSASAAGFALIEQSASGMGNAFAGAAATAEDASTIFFNPAGMSLLSGPQFAVAGHAIDLSLKFSNSGSSRTAGNGTIPLGPTSGGNGGEAGGVAFVPNIYLTAPINEKLTIGLGINAPFGLKTEYDSTWVGRYQGIETRVETYNINPAVSYKISDTLAIGAGVDYQRLKVKFTNAVATGLPGPTSPDALANLDADDDTWGWNIGLIAQLSPATR